jgi:hypothetical protein
LISSIRVDSIQSEASSFTFRSCRNCTVFSGLAIKQQVTWFILKR